jgi:SAM-dependent methyltransferase
MTFKNYTDISQQTIDRYNNRLLKFGKDIKTLGWGSTEQQEYRFLNIVSYLDLDEKSILDIGCGFGDLFTFIDKNSNTIKNYTGWDINPDLLKQANHTDNPKVKYDVRDISNELIDSNNIFDIGIMLGLLNFNLKSEELNYEYSKQLINNAFSAVKEVLVVDFLSTHLTPDYPKEDFVFYHDPIKMLEFALTLTPNVVIKHNYAPIPQKEFMLFLYK